MSEALPVEPFARLADPARYVACRMDLVADANARAHWVDFFCTHLDTLLVLGAAAEVRRGAREGDVQARVAAVKAEMVPHFQRFGRDPLSFGERVTILDLDAWRDRFLRAHGFVDVMVDLKARENDRMLPLLPQVLRELDTHGDGREGLLEAVRGVFAGNLFDMGAKASAGQFLDGDGPSFFATRDGLTPRPWRVDDFDAFAEFALGGVRRLVYFVDNAGSDFLLGALPLMRFLARRGARVVIAANERPTLNDMTVADVRAIWPRVTALAPDFATLPFEIVSTGTGEPLIDLSLVSRELNAAAADADLVLLEGMGRGVESNLDVELDCAVANLAMIKDEVIARSVGGKVFDCVCRFRSA